MKKPIISVIVPVYNKEKYLEKALDSILNQTFKELEIIVIDDKSTDKSREIIKKYKNIKIIYSKENEGAASSRNKGVKEARGEFIGFIDADDEIEETYFEELYQSIKKHNSEVAICDIQTVYEDKPHQNSLVRLSLKDGIVKVDSLLTNGLIASPTNKLIKKDLVLKYPFEEGIINEDITSIVPILVHAKKISYTSQVSYQYIQRKDSVQNSKMSLKKFDVFKAVNISLDKIKKNKNYKTYKEMLVYSQLINFLLYMILEIKDKKERKDFLKLYLAKMNTEKYDLFNNKYLKENIESMNKINKLYYQSILLLLEKKQITLANNEISLRNIYKTKNSKSVIKENITLEDLKDKAIKNQSLNDYGLKISVVIPNYNYEKFMFERIYSILNQKVKIHELIFLDDASTDKSIDLFNKIKKELSKDINIVTNYNKENSGCVFNQWELGFKLATGDYVWITEADDYCNDQFLVEVIKPLKKDKEVVLAYSNTSFIDEKGSIVYKNILPSIDLQNTAHWMKDYVNDGKNELQNYLYLNCTISNVSSVLFKKNIDLSVFEYVKTYKQIGDWMFYTKVVEFGKIAYRKKVCNYYRIHGKNVTSLTKKQNHYNEIIRWYKDYEKEYSLTPKQKENIKNRKVALEKIWNVREEK